MPCVVVICLLGACNPSESDPPDDAAPDDAMPVDALPGDAAPADGGPRLTDDRATTAEDTPVDIDIRANDAFGGAGIDDIEPPAHGRAEGLADGIRYTPDPDFFGEDRFAYRVADARAEVVVTVTPVNDAPRPVDDRAWFGDGPDVTVDVVANDVDVDGDPLEVVSVSAPRGQVAVDDDGRVVYTPPPVLRGAERVQYVVVDPSGAQGYGEVVIGLGDVGGPQPFADRFAVTAGRTTRLDVMANDVWDGEPPALRIDSAPQHMRLDVVDGRIEVIAPPAFNGTDRFEYALVDADGRAGRAEVRVTAYAGDVALDGPQVELPRVAITPAEVGVVVNADAPDSLAAAMYYVEARGIPIENIVTVALGAADRVAPEAFDAALAEAIEAAPDGIQAWALMWTAPFRVGCMSVTSAFAFGGFDDRFCNTTGEACGPTAPMGYYGHETTRPFDDLGLRPAMMVAGETLDDTIALIDRGVAADGTAPSGTGYLVRTGDGARSVRWPDMQATAQAWRDGDLDIRYLDDIGNALRDAEDVLFYFTGVTRVDGLDTIAFRPGAAADHLTSFGGVLPGAGGQMSILRWLEAGATGSYGTAFEPCNYTAKFPQVSALIERYFRGATLLEAYWTSVVWPGEGVFVGEPLARPWGRVELRLDEARLEITTTHLVPGRAYVIEGAADPAGPWDEVDATEVQRPTRVTLVVEPVEYAVYRLRAQE